LLVQFYSWFDGRATNQKLIKISDSMNWNFYETAEDMRFAYGKFAGWSTEDLEASERFIKFFSR
jgi:hypothetical protein